MRCNSKHCSKIIYCFYPLGVLGLAHRSGVWKNQIKIFQRLSSQSFIPAILLLLLYSCLVQVEIYWSRKGGYGSEMKKFRGAIKGSDNEESSSTAITHKSNYVNPSLKGIKYVIFPGKFALVLFYL